MRRALLVQRAARARRSSTARRGLVLGAAAGLVAVVVSIGTARWLSALPTFAVAEIVVQFTAPPRHLSRQAVVEAAGVRPGEALLALDLGTVAHRVKANAWVGEVVARRELPSRLVLHVTERRAALLVQLDRLFFADAGGRLIKPMAEGEGTDLPVVTGLDVEALTADPAATAARLVEAMGLLDLAAARLPVRVSELHVDEERGFVLRTAAPGVTIVVGDGPFGAKLDRAVRVLAYLAASGETAERIDLTYDHRAVVKTRSGATRTMQSGADRSRPGGRGTPQGGQHL